MEMSQPLALWLFLLLPLPLLLSRRRRARAQITVSSLYLWQLAAARSSRSIARPLRRTRWLMAVQMAAIAAAVLTLSGPSLTLAGGHTTLVMDVSASMSARDDGGTRFDVARERARTFVATLPRSSTITVIAAAESPRTLGTYLAADPRLLSVLESLAPTAGRADLAGAISVATGRREADDVSVFTDEPPASGVQGTASGVQWVTVGRADENTAILALAVRPLQLGSRAGQVIVSLQHFGTQARRKTVEILVDGRSVALMPADVPANGVRSLSLMLADAGQIVTARLQEDDALLVDNMRSAPVQPGNRLRVVLFGDAGSFLDAALAAHPLVELERRPRPVDGIAEVRDDTNVDVAVCDRCGDTSGIAVPLLTAWAQGDDSRQGGVTLADRAHRIAATLDPAQLTATVSPAEPSAAATVILRVGGSPAVTASDIAGKRRVDVHVDLTREDFALDPTFAVLVANSLDWLAATAIPPAIEAGQPLVIELPGGDSDPRITVKGPDDRLRNVERVGARSIAVDTDLAGIYRVSVNDRDHPVAVNPVIDGESDLQSPAEQALASNAQPLIVTTLDETYSLAGWCALLALAMITLEWRLRLARSS